MNGPVVLGVLGLCLIIGVTIVLGREGYRLVTDRLRRSAQRAHTRAFLAEVRAQQDALPPASGIRAEADTSPDPLAGLTIVSRSDERTPTLSDRDASNLVDFREFVRMSHCPK